MSYITPSSRDDFEIAIICAFETEYDAVSLIFDVFWDNEGGRYGKVPGDPNHYTIGRVGQSNVVLVLLPHIGKAAAASAAASMRSSYRAVKLVLLVGVCGGVPCGKNGEILLGDVIISDSIIGYDFGRQYPDELLRKDTARDNLGRPSKDIHGLLAMFKTALCAKILEDRTASILRQLQARAAQQRRLTNRYNYPGTAQDKLFQPNYRHKHHNVVNCICSDCTDDRDPICSEALGLLCTELGCDQTYLVARERLQDKILLERENSIAVQIPTIHIGAVASGDAVVRSGIHRDSIAKKESHCL
jgi:nucleoside phosphorylase